MLGLSTRKYAEVLQKMAETVGVSKSEVSRHFVEGGAEKLKELMERRLDAWDILVVYLEGSCSANTTPSLQLVWILRVASTFLVFGRSKRKQGRYHGTARGLGRAGLESRGRVCRANSAPRVRSFTAVRCGLV